MKMANTPTLSGLPKHGRQLLIGVNSFFILFSLLLIAAGLVLKFGAQFVSSFFESITKEMAKMAPDSGKVNIDLSKIDVAKTVGNHSVVMCLVILGFVALLSTASGLFGAKKSLPCLLITYGVLLGLFILVQLAVLLVILTNKPMIENLGAPGMLGSIRREYDGFDGTNDISVGWNFIMMTLSCCGLHDYGDFNATTRWNRRYFQDGWFHTLQTPLACCNYGNKDVDDFSCAINPSERTSHFRKGCFKAVWETIGNYSTVLWALTSLLFFVELLMLGSAILVARAVIKKRGNSTGTGSSTVAGNKNERRRRRSIFSDLTDDIFKRGDKSGDNSLSQSSPIHARGEFGHFGGMGFPYGGQFPGFARTGGNFATIQQMMLQHGMYSPFLDPTFGLFQGIRPENSTPRQNLETRDDPYSLGGAIVCAGASTPASSGGHLGRLQLMRNRPSTMSLVPTSPLPIEDASYGLRPPVYILPDGTSTQNLSLGSQRVFDDQLLGRFPLLMPRDMQCHPGIQRSDVHRPLDDVIEHVIAESPQIDGRRLKPNSISQEKPDSVHFEDEAEAEMTQSQTSATSPKRPQTIMSDSRRQSLFERAKSLKLFRNISSATNRNVRKMSA